MRTSSTKRIDTGAGAVLFSGCHPQDCYYITGQVSGSKRANRLKTIFERMGCLLAAALNGSAQLKVTNMPVIKRNVDAGRHPPEALKEEIERLRPEMARKLTRLPNIPGVQQALDQTDEIVR